MGAYQNASKKELEIKVKRDNIEFRFKKESVCCYIKGISSLLKREKINIKYYKSLAEKLLKLEKKVYEFYNKILPDGGIITRWIEKTEIITITSIKGGVGKSMVAIVFSYILRDMNKKILLFALDPQNSLASYFLRYIKDINDNNIYYLLKKE